MCKEDLVIIQITDFKKGINSDLFIRQKEDSFFSLFWPWTKHICCPFQTSISQWIKQAGTNVVLSLYVIMSLVDLLVNLSLQFPYPVYIILERKLLSVYVKLMSARFNPILSLTHCRLSPVGGTPETPSHSTVYKLVLGQTQKWSGSRNLSNSIFLKHLSFTV